MADFQYSLDLDTQTGTPVDAEEGTFWFEPSNGGLRGIENGQEEEWKDARKILSVPVDDSAKANNNVLTYRSSPNNVIYKPIGDIVGEAELGMSGNFFDSDKDYKEISSVTFSVFSSFDYAGSTKITPTTFRVVASRSGTTGHGEVRIFDFTNGNEVAIITNIVDDQKAIYETNTISNLPTGLAVFELQFRNSDANAKKLRLHSFKLF